MAAPTISDYTAYTGTKLTATDWTFNNQVTVNYLTDGTADITIGDLVCTSITVGGSLITDLYPIGGMIEYGGDTAPTGWMICDGTAISRTTYANLYAVIGTKYGVGDNSTTFNIPDLRDKFSIGKSDSKALGATGGSTTIVEANLPTHTHTVGTESVTHNHDTTMYGAGGHNHNVDNGLGLPIVNGSGSTSGFNVAGSNDSGHLWWVTEAVANHTHVLTNPTESATHNHAVTGGGSGADYLQPYVSVNKIIKY